ncbi:hypothetical protein K9M47_03480 [Candidatus Gracilibacteria bacterium]|nr:hypothetical protein [Candidatus Gracilibacteria bacterium]MCF7898657.1 hypothetical protein [Candidatus Paceibacterota bacterium]
MSTTIIALRGETSEKIVNGERMLVTPFVGTNESGMLAQLGIGLLLPENKVFTWGLVIPHTLIQSWRGMKILEQADTIFSNETLCACFTVASGSIQNTANYYIKALSGSFGSVDKLQEVRREVLASVPNESELEKMITVLETNYVQVDVNEIREEVKVGRLAMSPSVNRFLNKPNHTFRTHV